METIRKSLETEANPVLKHSGHLWHIASDTTGRSVSLIMAVEWFFDRCFWHYSLLQHAATVCCHSTRLLYEGALGDLNVSERSFGEVKVPVFRRMVFGTFRYNISQW